MLVYRLILTVILVTGLTTTNYASLSLLTPGFGSSNSNNNNQGSILYDHSEDITRIGGLLAVEELELRLGQGNIKLGSTLEYIAGSTKWGFHGTNDRVGLTMNDNMIFQIINDGVTIFHLKGDANFNDIMINEKDSKEIQLSLCILTMMIHDKEINEHMANRKCSEKTDVHLSISKMLRMLGSLQLKTFQMIGDVKVYDTNNIGNSNSNNNNYNNGDIVTEVNKAVTALADHFKLDLDVINKVIETSDRTSKSLTILQNDYVENSEKFKKFIIDTTDSLSRSIKRIDDLNSIVEDDVKITFMKKLDTAIEAAEQKAMTFSNETVDNILGLVRQINSFNSTITSTNETNMMLFQDLMDSLEKTIKTMNDMATDTKITIDKNYDISSANITALSNHFEDEMTYVHARAATLTDSCKNNTIMVTQLSELVNSTTIKLESSFARNISSLENDMVDSLSGLASNVSSVIATSNSIFAKAIGDVNSSLLLLGHESNTRFSTVNSTLQDLRSSITTVVSDFNASLSSISYDIDNKISIKLLDLNDSLIHVDNEIRLIIENMVFALQNDNTHINKSISTLAESLNSTIDARDTLTNARLTSLNDDLISNLGNKTEDLANVIESGLVHIVYQLGGVNESISILNDTISTKIDLISSDIDTHQEMLQQLDNLLSNNITEIYSNISATEQIMVELMNSISSLTFDNITIVSNHVTSFENDHKSDISKLDTDISNNHRVLSSHLVEVDDKVELVNTTINTTIKNLSAHMNSTITSLEEHVKKNKNDGNEQVELLYQLLDSNITSLTTDLSSLQSLVILNMTDLQKDIDTRFWDHVDIITDVIANASNNFTSVYDVIDDVRFTTSNNFTDVQKVMSILQASMMDLSDNFMKNDNITRKLLASTITELVAIVETNTLKLSEEVTNSISNVKEYANVSINLIRDRLSDLVHGQHNNSVVLYDLAKNQASDNAILSIHSDHIKALDDTDNELVNVIAQLHGNATSWSEQNNIINKHQDDDIKSLKTNDIANMQNINNVTIRLDHLSNEVLPTIKSSLEINSRKDVQIEQDLKSLVDKQEKLALKVLSIEDTFNTMTNKFTEINQKLQILEAYRTSRVNDDEELKKKLIAQDDKIQALANKNDIQNVELKSCESNSASLEKRIIALEAEALKMRTETVSVSEVDALRKLVNDMQTSMISHSSKVLELVMNSKLST